MSRCGKVINCGPRSPTTLAEVFLVTKTTRRGSFFASELNAVSILFVSIFVPGLDRQTAVFLHAPEMNSDQYECGKGKNHDVQDIKAQQRVFTHNAAPEKQKAHFVTDERHGGNDVGSDGDGPERQLIPGQQIAGVTEEQCHQQEHHPDNPVEFMRGFVAATIKDVKHVPEDREDHQVGGQAVEIPEEYAVRNDKLEVFHVAVGMWRRGVVIKHQQDSGDEQNDEKDERNRAEIVGGAHTKRFFANFYWHPVEEQIPENRQAART